MSHPTRGPTRSVGIGGQAMGAGGRHEVLEFSRAGYEAAPMSHPMISCHSQSFSEASP